MIWERSEGERRQQPTGPTTSQSPSRRSPPWLRDACTARKRPSQDDWTGNPERLGARLPSSAPGPGRPFPVEPLALPARGFPGQFIHQRLDKRPLSGCARGPPSCNWRRRDSQGSVKTRPTPRAVDSPRRWTRQQEPPRSHREWPDLTSDLQTGKGREPRSLWRL